MQGMQNQFGIFIWQIYQKLSGILAPDLVGMHEELATLMATIEDMVARPFPK